MKRTVLSALAAILLAAAIAPTVVLAQMEPTKVEFGTYFIIFANRGPNWKPQTDDEAMDVRMEVIANLRKSVEAGDMIIAGLVNDASGYEFVAIFQTEDEGVLRSALKNAPNVKNGFFKLEGHPMFAPLGLKLEPIPRN